MDSTGARPSPRQPLSDVQASLRDTFAWEIQARLPRLESLGAGDESVLDDARRDAHSLGSSAVIVEEPEIARLAHAVELDPALGPVGELVTALRGYVP